MSMMSNNSNVTVSGPGLEMINSIYITYQLPAIVFTSAMMLLGLPGNMIVFYIYFFKWRRSTSRMFILFLAALDMANCAVNLPMEIYIMRYSVMFYHPYLCKISRFSSYLMNSSSALILVAISVDRFRRICRPYKRSFSDSDSKYTCIGAVLFSIATTWPAFVLYGVRTIKIGNMIGQSCLIENQYDNSPYPGGFIIYMCIMTLAIFTVLTVLYYFVGLQIYKHRTFKQRKCTHVEKYQEQEKTTTGFSSAEQSPKQQSPINAGHNAANSDDNGNINVASNQVAAYSNQVSLDTDNSPEPIVPPKINVNTSSDHDTTVPNEEENPVQETDALTPVENVTDYPSTRHTSLDSQNFQMDQVTPTTDKPKETPTSQKPTQSSPVNKKQKKQKKRRVRYLLVRNSSTIHRTRGSTKCSNCITVNVGRSTYMLFLITIAYVISFLPFYTALIIRLFDETFMGRILNSKGSYMTYFVLIRSYLLSSAINPIIYSFCNAQFRTYCVETFTGVFKRRESVYYQRSKR